jgi:protein AIR1/2
VKPPAESIDIDSLAMPSGDVDLASPGGDNIWQTRFMKWCTRLMALNKGQERLKDAALLREAWGLWLETHVFLSRSRRAAGVEAAKKTDLGPEILDRMFSEASETDPQGPWIESPQEAERPEGSESEQQSNGQPKSNEATRHGVQQETKDTYDWALPPPPSASDFEVGQKDQRGWEERFVSWCKALIQLNEKPIKVTTTRERNRVAESYLRWVGTVDGLSKAKAAAARRTAVHYAQDNSARLAAIFAYTPRGAPPQTTESASLPQEDAAASPTAAVSDGPDDGRAGLLDGEDAEYRERYFPGVELSERFCHMCASHGHDAADCPEMTCRFCSDPGHRSFSCPTRLRCTKCRQLGHAKNDCMEKLALPQDDMECGFCQSRDHEDASCDELWRSFRFNPATARKVRSLPVFCYCCGREGHYGPDCGLNPQKTEEGPWETWSRANCDRYLDPASSEIAIIFAASAGSSSSGRPDLGKSIVPQRHIFFEEAEDDDDAEEFIRPPVQKSARVGQINFAGNTTGGARGGRKANKQYNDRDGRTGHAQPPLPPGPPPPLPPQGYQESRNGGRRRGGGRRY